MSEQREAIIETIWSMTGGNDVELSGKIADAILALPAAPGQPEQQHAYSPDYEAQGDCRICGHTYDNCTGSQPEQPSVAEAARVLRETRQIVCDAAETGFNCHDGDWADRLFRNNGQITAVLRTLTQEAE